MLSPSTSASSLDSKAEESSTSARTNSLPSTSSSQHNKMPLKSALRSPAAIDHPSFQDLSIDSTRGGGPSSQLTSPRPTTASTTFSVTSSSSNRRPSSSGGYVPRVSFNNTSSSASGGGSFNASGGGTGIEQYYTLRASTSHFTRTRESRTFLVATDMNEYSMGALNWCLDSLVEDGDDLVVLRVFDPASSSTSLTKASAAELAEEEANTLLRIVTERNCPPPSPQSQSQASSSSPASQPREEDREDIEPINEIGITIEHVVGKVQDSIQKMIKVYRPDSLIVGTRGRSDSIIKSAFIGSVSRYCVAHSPIPVIVVRPTRKVRKSVDKRGHRQTYLELVGGKGRPGSSSG